MMCGKRQAVRKQMLNILEMLYIPVFECYGDSLIIDIIPFPDLYLLIVPVTTMYTKLHEVIFTFLIVNYISLFVNNY